MNCEIIVKISRSNIQIFYSQNKNAFKIFKYEDSENIPLYVFSDGNDFEIGELAKLKHQNSYSNSYCDYFDLIKDTKATFPFLDGEDKKMGYILILAIEKILKDLFEMLLISDNVSDLRESIKLNLVFSNDISDIEINFLVNVFKDFGYKKCKFICYNYLIINYLDSKRKIDAFNGYIVIDAIDNDLQIDFFDSLVKKYPKIHKEGVDLASDPKVKILAKEMYQQTADSTGSLTSEKTEIAHLIPLAQKHVNTTKSEFRVQVVLTDGASKNVKIKMNSINEKASYLSNFTKDFDLVKTVVKQSNVPNIDLAFVIKSSVVSNNFIDNLRSVFNNVYCSNDEFVEVLELFINNESLINQGDFGLSLSVPVIPKENTPATPINSKRPSPPSLPSLGVKPKLGSIKDSSTPPKAPPSLPPLGAKPKLGSIKNSSTPPKAPPSLPPLGAKPKLGSIKNSSTPPKAPPSLPPLGVKPKLGSIKNSSTSPKAPPKPAPIAPPRLPPIPKK